jgi:L-asparaginase/Glu-tRNA(Gln) amidotransferase subunit D
MQAHWKQLRKQHPRVYGLVRASRVPIGAVLIKGKSMINNLVPYALMKLNPQKARVLLMLALLKKRSWTIMQKLFIEY